MSSQRLSERRLALTILSVILLLLASGLVLVSEFAFNGTIVPVAIIIFGYVCVAIIWYALIQRNDLLVEYNYL